MTVSMARDPHGASSSSYDLLVVGGGFYGAMLTLEASRRGLSVLLLERDDFGGATSWNSLRIVHGGLRYLQGLDLRRYRESVAERRWFLRHFPDLVEPLPCLMPLYDPPRGGRLRRPSVLNVALTVNEALSRHRNEGLQPDREVPAGRLFNPVETARLFPAVDRKGLLGGALWYDAVMPDSQRVLVEALRWAHRCGARTLNYTEAVELRMDGEEVTGLRAMDRETGRSLELRGRAVVNCAGPWSRQLAGRFDRDLPELFRPLLAFNVLLDRKPLASEALAVAARGKRAQTWFLLPWKGRVLAGTSYVASPGGSGPGAVPDEACVEELLASLNAAVPGWNVRSSEVLRVCHGWLPAKADGSAEPAGHPVIHDHGKAGGPRGLFSVSGVKLTTARAVAERTLARLFERRGERLPAPGWIGRPDADPPLSLDGFLTLAARDREAARTHVRGIVERQSVIHLEDLLLRRADWGVHPEGAAAARLCTALGWSEGRAQAGLRAAGRGNR
ncbi:MAG TPA: FAD-dependent oxidoreductase [Thermoanaerobaculia bacterium]|nr:FAD-dependent oxidoreductase [Thermoanaerobaculia bacterium]